MAKEALEVESEKERGLFWWRMTRDNDSMPKSLSRLFKSEGKLITEMTYWSSNTQKSRWKTSEALETVRTQNLRVCCELAKEMRDIMRFRLKKTKMWRGRGISGVEQAGGSGIFVAIPLASTTEWTRREGRNWKVSSLVTYLEWCSSCWWRPVRTWVDVEVKRCRTDEDLMWWS